FTAVAQSLRTVGVWHLAPESGSARRNALRGRDDRGPVGSPVLAHGLNLPDPPSLLARSPVSARGLPRTLSFARRQAAVLRWRDRRLCQPGERDAEWRLR